MHDPLYEEDWWFKVGPSYEATQIHRSAPQVYARTDRFKFAARWFKNQSFKIPPYLPRELHGAGIPVPYDRPHLSQFCSLPSNWRNYVAAQAMEKIPSPWKLNGTPLHDLIDRFVPLMEGELCP